MDQNILSWCSLLKSSAQRSGSVSISQLGIIHLKSSNPESSNRDQKRKDRAETSNISRIHIISPCIVLKGKKGKSIAGPLKCVNQHKGSYMNPPFSFKLSLKWTPHFRPVCQEAEARFHIIIRRPVEAVQFFQVFADWRMNRYSVRHHSTLSLFYLLSFFYCHFSTFSRKSSISNTRK